MAAKKRKTDDVFGVVEEQKDPLERQTSPSKATISLSPILFLKCPTCGVGIMVSENEINCKIFRCGVGKLTGEAIPPHLSEKECKYLVEQDLIFGCGSPFELFKISDIAVDNCVCCSPSKQHIEAAAIIDETGGCLNKWGVRGCEYK